jgi:intein/homing endonuclease
MIQSTIDKFEKNNIVELYKDGISISKLMKIVKSSDRNISKYLKSKGLTVKNTGSLGMNKSGLKFEESIFNKIDNEEKAYWLGFIFADGYISSSDFIFELSLSEKDKSHLDKFNSFMRFKGSNIRTCLQHKKFNICKWNIRNKFLWNSLNSLGCIPRKSLILKFPKIEIFDNPDLIRHFIRGYFDGDGCVNFNHKIISILGTEDMLSNIKEKSCIKTNSKLYYKYPNSKTRILQISCKKAFEFLNFIYKDSSIFLERKYKIYEKFRRLYE